VFTDCATVIPTTLASHTSLFTGKYPHHHGVPRNGFMVAGDNEMLPEILQEAGFHTAGFVGSFALDRRFDFAQGFDHFDQEFDVFVRPDGPDQDQRSADLVTDAVIRYLDELVGADRLFLFVHYFDPHRPYAPAEPFDRLYDPLGREGLQPIADVLNSQIELPLAARQELARRQTLQYAGEISYLDLHVGRLLDDLRRRGVLEQALVVVVSDHGESFWAHSEQFDHGLTVYQPAVRAICMARLPGSAGVGAQVDEVVANIDILPTVLGFLGLEIPKGIDGEPIPLPPAPGSLPSRVRFGEASKPHRGVETDPLWVNSRKARYVRDGRFKFIQTPFLGTEELYDLAADPHEQTNLLADASPQMLAVADRLRQALEAWTASASPLPSKFEPSQREETIERLRALGYLE
jgi:arylsulfatase A-like enzyme